MSILSRIVEKKKERLSLAKSLTPLNELKARLRDAEKTRDFNKAVKRANGQIKLIAEIKKASPSKGVIRQDFDPVAIARTYEEKAVDAVSILTEDDFFSGELRYIPAVKEVTTIPLLRKDFIFDEYQIYESRANRADAILLIAAIIDNTQAGEYIRIADELGLGVLFEVHDREELEKALRIDARIIGINNRNLNTLAIDLNTTFELKKMIPADKTVVSESAIKTRDDVVRLESAGIDAMLIGTSIMESPDIGRKIDELRGRS